MKKAVIIGISYKGTSQELYGTHNDANNIKVFLENKKYSCILMKDDKETPTEFKPTRSNILRELNKIIREAQSGQKIFIFYAGHGSRTKDRNGDEKDGYDEVICSLNGHITDDELHEIIVNQIRDDAKVRCLFDCCHSGTCLDLQWRWLIDYKYFNENTNPELKDVVCLSGCLDHEPSAEAYIGKCEEFQGNYAGAMTFCFIKSMIFAEKYHKDMTLKELMFKIRFLLMEAGYTQVPQLSMSKRIYLKKKVIELF